MPYLNNHLRFIIKYHKDEAFVGARIVGFEVEAFSVHHTYKGVWGKDAQLTSVPLSPTCRRSGAITEPGEFIFTYDVTWEESEIRWASRWDLYLYMGDDQIHWFSILNSLAIVLLLTGIVSMIMMRTLRRDLSRYNSPRRRRSCRRRADGSSCTPTCCARRRCRCCSRATVGTHLLACSCSACRASRSCARWLGFLSPANRGAAAHRRRCCSSC